MLGQGSKHVLVKRRILLSGRRIDKAKQQRIGRLISIITALGIIVIAIATQNRHQSPDNYFPRAKITISNQQLVVVQFFPHEDQPIPQALGPVTPTPTPTKEPTSPAVISSGAVQDIIREVFGTYADSALRIASCESGFNPNAYNSASIGGSHAAGLFQILYPSTWSGTPYASSSPYDARANASAAYYIFQRDGYSWREWACT